MHALPVITVKAVAVCILVRYFPSLRASSPLVRHHSQPCRITLAISAKKHNVQATWQYTTQPETQIPDEIYPEPAAFFCFEKRLFCLFGKGLERITRITHCLVQHTTQPEKDRETTQPEMQCTNSRCKIRSHSVEHKVQMVQ